MFARVHTPEREHELEHLVRDSLHDGGFSRDTEVDERPDVEAPDGAMPVNARPEAVAIEDLAERRDVVDEPVGWNGGVFDERQWPSRSGARRHQKPETRLADLQERRLVGPDRDQCVIAVPVLRPGRRQMLDRRFGFCGALTVERNEEQGIGVVDQDAPEGRVFEPRPGKVEDRSIDQLDRRRAQLKRVLRRGDGVGRRAEMSDDRRLPGGSRYKADPCLGNDRQRSFRADDERGQIDVGVLSRQAVEPIAPRMSPEGGLSRRISSR